MYNYYMINGYGLMWFHWNLAVSLHLMHTKLWKACLLPTQTESMLPALIIIMPMTKLLTSVLRV